MSAFLGHIHYWLYKKIRLLLDREAVLVARCDDEFDGLGTEMYEQALSLYGEPLSKEKPLEEIIDHGNIHGWLHHQITCAEVREATFIKDMVDIMGDDARNLFQLLFLEDGKKAAQEAKGELDALLQEGQSLSAGLIYKVMQNYYLNGMPCDGGDQVIENQEHCFAWVGGHPLQAPNWQKAGVSHLLMCQLYSEWFKGFVEGLEKGARFEINTRTNPETYMIYLK